MLKMDHWGEYKEAFGALRRFALPSRSVERCELCSAPLGSGHPHLLETKARRIMCACDACALLMTPPGGRYKRIPGRVELLADFQLSDSEWDGMAIPIGMAFFFKNGETGKITALYPGPGGARSHCCPSIPGKRSPRAIHDWRPSSLTLRRC